MLKLLGARPLGFRDTAAVLHALDEDPVGSCMVAARVQQRGVNRAALRGELWSRGRPAQSLCYSGANLVPLRGDHEDLRAFADRACRGPRLCSSLVGRSDLVLPLWDLLESEWGPAREVRPEQPLLALFGDSLVTPDPLVRRVHLDQVEPYLEAAISMFIEEVGVDPRMHDGGRGYRSRVVDLIAEGRAWARFEDDQVVFKAEVGSLSNQVGQIQGVWVRPELRDGGFGSTGTATVAQAIQVSGRTASLYVNSFNRAARRAYEKIGFTQVETFATVLVD